MFKTSEEIIVIQAEATTAIPTGVVFWSHDKGTAKLIIQLKKDQINQTLPQGTIVPILLEFNSDTAAKGKGRHIYHAIIENALEGIVSIVLEDNILGYVGRVDGSVYIELPDSRSIDTAGRFTFDIRRSPIDEDVPELEDYYWQGFNEIIQESKRLIDQVESNCKTVLNDLSSKVTSLENQTSDIKSKQAEILKSIEEHDVFTKQESSANVIYQLIGKETARITLLFDFEGKVAASNIENPHQRLLFSGPSLGSLTDFAWHSGQEAYDRTSKLDGVVDTRTNNVNSNKRQERCDWNVVVGLEQALGVNLFSDQGATTILEKVNVARRITKKIRPIIYGFGSSAGGNKLTHKRWLDSGWESGGISTVSKSVTKLELPSENENTINAFIRNDGIASSVGFAEPSDGTTASTVVLDYACLELTIELSMNQYLKSLIAANHVENLATQDEAETGEDNTKTMTPLRVFQSIAQWTKNKFISLTENETVLGIKNFANGLQVGGNNVLSQNGEIVFDHTSETDSSIQSGIVRFKRYGDWILVNFNFQCRSTNIASGGNLIGVLEADIIPSGSIQVDITYDKALTIDASGKVTALWGLDANKYYIGSAMYYAKNKL